MVDYINKKLVGTLLPKRKQNSNKMTFGKILNIAGSKRYVGSALLSSIAALKSGAGYVSLASVDEVLASVSVYAPEVTHIRLKSNENGSISNDNIINDLSSYNVISVGCGITTDESVKKFLFDFLPKISDKQRLVIDADAINILSANKGEISFKNAIITPHPKELSRLLNVSVAEINENREKYARITSQTYDCITVLKGNGTIVSNGEKIYINQSGNSALAKAGTGDVLTGIIAGMLAQGLKPIDAAIASVYLHGLSGDMASSHYTEYCVLASDVVTYLPYAFKEVIIAE